MKTPAALRVKICGITRPEDARLAVEAGADLIGMVFYPPSPRAVTLEQARAIVATVRSLNPQVRVVAVTVNAPTGLLRALWEQVGVDWIQFHGDEPPARVAQFAPRGFKALRMGPHTSFTSALAYAAAGPPEGPRLLVDAAVPGRYGGTGRTTDWDLARRLAERVPLLLAGGLTPENVAAAVRAVRPWGVDVSSGVEAAPGRKDPAKVRAFVARARAALEEVVP